MVISSHVSSHSSRGWLTQIRLHNGRAQLGSCKDSLRQFLHAANLRQTRNKSTDSAGGLSGNLIVPACLVCSKPGAVEAKLLDAYGNHRPGRDTHLPLLRAASALDTLLSKIVTKSQRNTRATNARYYWAAMAHNYTAQLMKPGGSTRSIR